MGKKVYSINEKQVAGIVKSTINEFLNRDFADKMQSFGITDPSAQYTVNEGEIKQKCEEFLQKCDEFNEYLTEFDKYLNWIEEEVEDGEEQPRQQYPTGVRMTMKYRNMFGARDFHDEYLEEDLNYLSEAVSELRSKLSDAYDCAETLT